jgi:hypothetical protein
MPGRKIVKQQEFDNYLNKWGLAGFVFAVKPNMYGDAELFAFPHGEHRPEHYGLHEIRSLPSLIRAAKRAQLVKLWVKGTEFHVDKNGRRYGNQYQHFDSWDAFREYCVVIKLSGI